MSKLHIRTGDKVVVLSGKTKGKTGTVIRVWPEEGRALIEGEAAIYDTKHVRANPQANQAGGRQQRLRPLAICKLALVDPTTGKPTRIRRVDGVRVAVKSGHKFTVAK